MGSQRVASGTILLLRLPQVASLAFQIKIVYVVSFSPMLCLRGRRWATSYFAVSNVSPKESPQSEHLPSCVRHNSSLTSFGASIRRVIKAVSSALSIKTPGDSPL